MKAEGYTFLSINLWQSKNRRNTYEFSRNIIQKVYGNLNHYLTIYYKPCVLFRFNFINMAVQLF